MIPNPPICEGYYYQAWDRSSPACACGSGSVSGLLRVYENGILKKTDAITTRCGLQGNVYFYTYQGPFGCPAVRSGPR